MDGEIVTVGWSKGGHWRSLTLIPVTHDRLGVTPIPRGFQTHVPQSRLCSALGYVTLGKRLSYSDLEFPLL